MTVSVEFVPIARVNPKQYFVKVEGSFILDGKTGGAALIGNASEQIAVVRAMENWENLKCVSP